MIRSLLRGLISLILRLPLSWKQLKYQKSYTLAAVLGIAFTTILLFMQIECRSGLIESFAKVPASFKGDIFLTEARSTNLNSGGYLISSRQLYKTLAIEGVESVTPLYFDDLFWRTIDDEKTSLNMTRVIGFSLEKHPLNLPDLDVNLDRLKIPNTFLINDVPFNSFDPVISSIKSGEVVRSRARFSSKQASDWLQINGIFKGLTSNARASAFLLTSDATFLKLRKDRIGLVDIGIIQLIRGSNVENIIKEIRQFLDENVVAYTKQELVERERNFYDKKTSVGLLFRFTLVISVLIALVFLSQIFYSKISKNLSQYATLKAIGYSHLYLVWVILGEVSILVVLGYIPGFICSWLLLYSMASVTRLPISVDPETAINVLIYTYLICGFASGISLLKLKQADPADLFA